jgi:hypothetical protein
MIDFLDSFTKSWWGEDFTNSLYEILIISKNHLPEKAGRLVITR